MWQNSEELVSEFVNSNGLLELFILAWSAFWMIVALHWAPWPIWIGADLKPPWTYVIGVGDMVGHYTIWLLWVMPTTDLAVFGILLIVGAVGLGVMQTYRLDELGAKRRQAKFGGQGNDAH